MTTIELPSPTITLSKTDARRFLLAHQRLWPPRRLRGKDGIMEYVRHVGCIQFDPINVVGRNPDLVLQSRVVKYRPRMLEELLYTDRRLLDGWDKVSSIHQVEDWPYFSRHRAYMRERHGDPSNPPMEIASTILDNIGQRGPLSSIDLKHGDKVDWSWGQLSRLARASLDTLYVMGDLVVHHRVGSRRVFDLTERLLPEEVISAPDPNQTVEEYQNWHILRRVGGLGLANPSAAQYWGAILGVNNQVRRTVLVRLVERGELTAVAVEGVPNRTFFIRTDDLPTLEAVRTRRPPKARAAFVAALDNLVWDRNILRWIYDFDYVWEVYKPAAKRKYGYYVLPVIYGDRFVARVDPAYDRKQRTLILNNWWWEEDVQLNDALFKALVTCLQDFMRYLNAERVRLGRKIAGSESMRWVRGLNSD